MGKIISCDKLSIKYDSILAVNNVSFELESQDYLCILGENGSGKTTLMKGILGLSKPTSGKISFFGVEQKDIGYLPQQTPAQKDFPADVSEVVLSGCLNKHGLTTFYTKSDKRLMQENLQFLGIEDLSKRPYRDLSGGQQQRVLLARALCAAKKILMLDEPVTGLDPTGTAEMYLILQKLNKERNMTIIMISHDIQGAVKYCSKILHIKTSVLFFGTSIEYSQTKIGSKMLANS